jgi:hypothetical protein
MSQHLGVELEVGGPQELPMAMDPNGEGLVYGSNLPVVLKELDALSEDLGQRALTSFAWEDPELLEEALEFAEEMDDGGAAIRARYEDLQNQQSWYESAEGLRAVQALLDHLHAHPEFEHEHPDVRFAEAGWLEWIRWDLQAIVSILDAPAEDQVRFRLTVE